MRLLNENCDVRTLSPLTLAFIGDAVFDLLVREELICAANRPVGALNSEKVALVCCKNQAAMAEKLLPHLTEEEAAVYRRGKNAGAETVPKNASRREYHMATGLEALFGYLYLKGSNDRLRELYHTATSNSTNV